MLKRTSLATIAVLVLTGAAQAAQPRERIVAGSIPNVSAAVIGPPKTATLKLRCPRPFWPYFENYNGGTATQVLADTMRRRTWTLTITTAPGAVTASLVAYMICRRY